MEPIESTLGRRQLRFVLAWAELIAVIDVLDRMRGPVFADARTHSGFAEVTVGQTIAA